MKRSKRPITKSTKRGSRSKIKTGRSLSTAKYGTRHIKTVINGVEKSKEF